MPKSVFLVGGSGFLGLHMINEFWAMNPRPEIHVFDIRPLPENISKSVYQFDPAAIKVYTGDLTSETDVAKALNLAEPDVIVHSASPVHGLSDALYQKVNVEGTKNLLACAQATPSVRAFVYTSSSGVVFYGQDVHGADESYPFPEKDMDGYNRTKHVAEELVLAANNGSKFRTIALRPAGIFGPGDRQMIPELRKMPLKGQHRFQLGDNNNLFDVTYVTNVTYAHRLAVEKLLDEKLYATVAGEPFLITNDSPIYFWSFARTIWKHDGYIANFNIVLPRDIAIYIAYAAKLFGLITRKEPNLTPYRVKVTCAVRYFNIDKAKSLLGYEPRVDLEDAIIRTLKAIDESN